MNLKIRFVAEKTLGKLAKYLRLLGYDTICDKQKNNDELLQFSIEQGCILLLKKKVLENDIKNKNIFLIFNNNPKKQLEEVMKYFKLSINSNYLFTRCTLCNEKLVAIKKENAEGMVSEYIINSHNIFFLCPNCKRVFWPGSHLTRIIKQFNQTAFNLDNLKQTFS